MPPIAEFFNASLCVNGRLEQRPLHVNLSTGLICNSTDLSPSATSDSTTPGSFEEVAETYDLRGHIIAPAYIDLQTNGAAGFSFDIKGGLHTVETQEQHYSNGLKRAAKTMLAFGVGSFLATLPTLSEESYKKILPELQPRTFSHGAELLGVHCEGPWLNPAQKVNHDSSLMQLPLTTSPEDVFGASNISNIKMVTLAPELPGAMDLMVELCQNQDRVGALGHSTGGADAARFAYHCGGTCIAQIFHAMSNMSSQDPGLIGWIASRAQPFFTLVVDGRITHPYLVTMAFRTNPSRCILVSDSSPALGFPDGNYQQATGGPLNRIWKKGNRLLRGATEEEIGSCIGLDESVRNLVKFSRCTLAEAVRCVTENAASYLGLSDRGFLEPGQRGDFVILNEAGVVLEVWQSGRCTFRP